MPGETAGAHRFVYPWDEQQADSTDYGDSIKSTRIRCADCGEARLEGEHVGNEEVRQWLKNDARRTAR